MCGISGYLDTESRIDCKKLIRMTDIIRHRGPDDEGYALIDVNGVSLYSGEDTMPELALPRLTEERGKKAFLALGHRRLSILDLSAAGHQPMHLTERNITLTYNGEIYNYIELRKELELCGYTFRTDSDTEVLLYAYCQWGEDCLSHFNGMWGFALWDGEKKKLFCARDRLGAKPFHYYRNGNRFIFGSELKQICQDEELELQFNRAYLAENLIYHISDYSEDTLIQDIYTLKPGHKLVVQLDASCQNILSVMISPYWELLVRYDYTLSQEQWLEAIEAEFSRSCTWRMRSDAPLGALLSGGLDSSCMVTEMCRQMNDPSQLNTFTTTYPGDSTCDEWNFANLINQTCGCKGNPVTPDPKPIESCFEKIVWTTEGISSLSLLGPQQIFQAISQRGFKVLLNGQCGDELMLGYERYYAFYFLNLLKRGKLATAQLEFNLASRHSKLNIQNLFAQFLYFNIPFIRNTRQYRRAGSYIKTELLQCCEKEKIQQILFQHTLEKLQLTELTKTQLTHIVRFDDRLYMGASLESRIPFMDYRLVELACRIPPEFKIKDGYTKHIMRRLFDSRMPKEVVWRTNKMGFEAPTQIWAERFPADYFLDRIHCSKVSQYFKLPILEQMVLNGYRGNNLFVFLSVEEFARQFHVQP